jgi:hypothetical protein
MDEELCAKRPPWLIEATVKLFTPREFRQGLAVQLLLDYTTLLQYLIQAALGIRLMVADNAREAFNVRRHAGDVLSVIIGYCAYCWMTASIGRLAAILAVAIPVLIWCDAHKHRKPSPGDAVTDGFLVGVTVLVSQVLLFSPTGLSGMAWTGLLTGTGMSMVFVSGWRTVFSMKDPASEPALEPDRRAWRMTLLWLIGAFALLTAGRQILDSNSQVIDFVLGAAFFPVFTISLLLRAGTMCSLLWGPVIKTTLFTHVEKEDLHVRMNRLLRTAFSGFWSQFFERIVFIWVALPIAVVLAGAALGRIPAESVNWMLWVSTAGGFAILCKTWTEVKKINERAAAVLQKEIEATGN